MNKLKKVKIHKYRCIEKEQSFEVEPDYTILVGVNESGKTSVLHSIASVQYFEDDSKFKYDMTRDYPRSQLKEAQKVSEKHKAVTLTFELSKEITKEISDFLGYECNITGYDLTKYYDNSEMFSLNEEIDQKAFLEHKLKNSAVSDEYKQEILASFKSIDFDGLTAKMKQSKEPSESILLMGELKECMGKKSLISFVYHKFIQSQSPKFMYYDEYYSLPSEVRLDKITLKSPKTDSDKTAAALIELAKIEIDKIENYTNFEGLVAELEATESILSKELFRYWQTNRDLKIEFKVRPIEEPVRSGYVEKHIAGNALNIRVKNPKRGVSLPLENRSRGFNWFFSFLVWFKKIQSDTKNTYIVLLDEPGLNLHGNAQADLLKFIEDISKDYQVIYTTHSPFMIPLGSLNNVRTVVEKDDGTVISDSIQESDPATLFPLQAALGYSIAQNLFISENNLLVEGPSDLTYLTHMSSILESLGRVGLSDNITLVPTGGADKVASFVSLFRGNKLNVACLLDTFSEDKARDRLEDLANQNIIEVSNILYFSEFTNSSYADIEDMFEKSEYLVWWNEAFQMTVKVSDLDEKVEGILKQLEKLDGKKSHYTPSRFFAKNAALEKLSESTLDRFEKLFKKIDRIFEGKKR